MYVCAFRPLGGPLQKADVFGPLARLRQRGEPEPATLEAGPFLAAVAEGR